MSTLVQERQYRKDVFRDRHHNADIYAQWKEQPYDTWRTAVPSRAAALNFLGPVAGRRILLCGVGPEAVIFARAAADVYGFGSSDIQIEGVKILARRLGLRDRIHVQVLRFEQLAYPNDFFDLAFGQALPHNADLERGARELARVLKSTGRAAFIELLGKNAGDGVVKAGTAYERATGRI
jgi:SAM-dependent methyltransferase